MNISIGKIAAATAVVAVAYVVIPIIAPAVVWAGVTVGLGVAILRR